MGVAELGVLVGEGGEGSSVVEGVDALVQCSHTVLGVTYKILGSASLNALQQLVDLLLHRGRLLGVAQRTQLLESALEAALGLEVLG